MSPGRRRAGISHQLVAGGSDPDPDAAERGHGSALLSQQGLAGHGEGGPGGQQQVSGSGLLAPAPHVLTRPGRHGQMDQVAILTQLLHGHDGVSSRGQRSARHDAHGGARCHREGRGIAAGEEGAEQPTGVPPIRGPQGHPVHGGPVSGGVVPLGPHLGQGRGRQGLPEALERCLQG